MSSIRERNGQESAPKPKPLGITVADRRDVAIVSPQGSIDYYHLAEFRDALSQLIEKGRCKIVVDLAHARYIASTTIGVLISQKAKAADKNGDLRLCRLAPGLWKMFQLLGVDSIFQLSESVDAAVKSFQ